MENLDSGTLVLLDTVPLQAPSSGEGASGVLRVQQDQVAATAAGGVVGATYRLARFPVEAKVKRVHLYTSGCDSNAAATEKLDVNVAFSDSQYDGTNPNLQGTIPTTALNGTVTTVAAYAAPNKLFGAAVPLLNAGAAQELDVTYKGAYLPQNALVPLWSYFGFVNNAGTAQSPGGNFDILLYVSTAAATGAAGDLGVEVDFVI